MRMSHTVCADVGSQAGVEFGNCVILKHPGMATWPVKMPTSMSLSDTNEALRHICDAASERQHMNYVKLT